MVSLFRHRAVAPLSASAATFAVAAAGGALFALAALPAPWLSGPLVAVTLLALAGFPARVPDVLRKAAFLMLGVSIGAAVTPETLASVWTWPITMALLVLSMPATMIAVVLYLRLASGWDNETGYYASAPGAMSAVLANAALAGVDLRKVAFVQSVRVFFLVVALPGLFTALGLADSGPAAAPAPAALADDPFGFVLMTVVGIAAGLAADRMGLPGGLILGSMVTSAILHGSGYVEAQVPLYLLIPGFVVLGAFVGARFVGTDFALLRRLGADSFAAFVVAMAIATLFALAAAALSGEGVGKTILAFAPGGFEVMVILAFTMGLDPAFVGAHHLVRFVLVALLLPVCARLLFGKAR